jgi:phenylalanyl-tRNA synthetase alpha subunit
MTENDKKQALAILDQMDQILSDAKVYPEDLKYELEEMMEMMFSLREMVEKC